MNKVELICDVIHRINDNIQIGETERYIKLVLKGRLLDNQYKTVYEIINNHIVAIDEDDTRYIISNTGDIIDSWEDSENNIDEYYIGRYLDNVLKDNISLSEIISHRLTIVKASNKTVGVMLLIKNTTVKGTYIISLYNVLTYNKIESLIVRDKICTKFIDNNIVREIHIINKDIKYIRNYDIFNGYKYIGGNIYNKDIIISPADDYYSYIKNNNLVIIKINRDTFGIIYNNSLQETTYKFIGIGVNCKILYTQEKNSGRYILYDVKTLEVINGIEDLSVNIINDYRQFQYKVYKQQFSNTVRSIME